MFYLQKILENGRQVAESEATMGSEYTYGWNSSSCPNHIFRIEAELGVTDQTYYFSIDGQNFNAFPREPMKVSAASHAKSNVNQGRSPVKAYSPSDNKSYAATKSKANPQGNNWGEDPFTASDPFGDRHPVTTSASSDPFRGRAASSASASSTDPFGEKVSPSPSDPFGDFKPTTKSAAASFDPFGDSASLPVAKSINNHNIAKQQGGSTSQAAPSRTAHVVPAVDLLNDHPIGNTSTHKGSYLDDFASLSVSSAAGSNASPSKDIYNTLNDPFAPKPIIVPTASNTPVPVNAKSPNKANDFELDSATKSLVSLDLNPTNKSAPKNRQAEYEKNLPLNTLMGTSNTNKTAIMTSDAISQPQLPPMRVMSSAETISALGPAPPRPMMMGGGPQMMMGGGMGGQPYGGQPMSMSGGMSGMYGGGVMQQQPMGNPYGAPHPATMATGGVAQYGSYGQPAALMGSKTNTPQKAGSALDALDWKM